MMKQTKGFTIVELMIATVVFSVILLLITGAIIQIGRSYTKGITTTRTQEAARRVVDDVSEAIKFTPGDPDATKPNTVCIGQKVYAFSIGRQVTDNPNTWGLITNPNVTCDAIDNGAAAPAGFSEMLGERMRVAKFSVAPLSIAEPNAYVVTVRVVSGDDDVLCDDDASCNSDDVLDAAAINGAANLRCKNTSAGNEFCAMSELSVTVSQRI